MDCVGEVMKDEIQEVDLKTRQEEEIHWSIRVACHVLDIRGVSRLEDAGEAMEQPYPMVVQATREELLHDGAWIEEPLPMETQAICQNLLHNGTWMAMWLIAWP